MNTCAMCEVHDDMPDVPGSVTLTWGDGYQEDLCRPHAAELIDSQCEISAPVQFAYDHPTGRGCEYALTGIIKTVRTWNDGRVAGPV